jgi:hypothetical protein
MPEVAEPALRAAIGYLAAPQAVRSIADLIGLVIGEGRDETKADAADSDDRDVESERGGGERWRRRSASRIAGTDSDRPRVR